MIRHRLGWLVGVIALAAVIGIRNGEAATSNDNGARPGHAADVVRVDADAHAGPARERAQQTSTYLRCYYRTSDNPFRLDTRYVWATDPVTGWHYRLPGEWHAGRKYHWQALFYTDEAQGDLHSLCDESLRRQGIDASVVMYAAGNSSLAFDYVPWSVGTRRGGIDRVVAFGDSLSDTHNLYNASRWRIPDSTSWFAGRFTNGRNWVEYLAGDLHVPLYDWAVGGVGVSDRHVLPWADIPGVLSQSLQWRRATHDDSTYDPGRTLFTVLVGGNDLIYFSTPVKEVLAKEQETLQVLISGGAKNILVLNLPDVSRAPIYRFKPGASNVAAKVRLVNQGLETMIASMQRQYGAELNIQLFDTNALFARLFDDPSAYGFQNSTESCLDIDRPGMSVFMESHSPRPECKNPDTFVFWDILHPTTHTHRLVADQVFAFVRQHFPVTGPLKS
jgi:thermolabile hemolysin